MYREAVAGFRMGRKQFYLWKRAKLDDVIRMGAVHDSISATIEILERKINQPANEDHRRKQCQSEEEDSMEGLLRLEGRSLN